MTLTFKLYTFSVDKLKGDDEDTKLIVYSNGTVVWDQSVISKVSFLSFLTKNQNRYCEMNIPRHAFQF